MCVETVGLRRLFAVKVRVRRCLSMEADELMRLANEAENTETKTKTESSLVKYTVKMK